MQDGQDDQDGGGFERPVSGQPVDVQVDVQRDVHEWLDAAIRASVDTEFGFHKAPPNAAAEWPDTQDNTQDPEQDPQEDPPKDPPRDLDDIADRDAGPAPFTPASAVRLRDRGVASAPPLRRSLDPVRVPAPRPNSSTRQRRPGPLLLYGPVVGGAAVVAYGIAVWGSPQLRNVTAADARPVIVDAQTEAQLAPHLIVHDQHVMANEPLPLEVAVDRTVPNASLRVAGLALGTHMSAGSAIGDSGWNVPLNGLKNLFMYAPTDFVGVMNSAVYLRGPDEKLIDRRKVKLEWVEPKQQPFPAAPPPAAAVNPAPDPSLSAEVATSLMQRGQDYLKNGDIASARIVFGRLAAAGVADGAFAAGQAYDSAYLSAHNVMGVSGDEAKARIFYQRAVQLGSAEAAAQLAKAK
jgi:hypothetical protein